MKVVIVLLLGLLSAGTYGFPDLRSSIFPPPPEDECGGLGADGLGPVMEEFIDLIPISELLNILFEALSENEDVIEAMMYFQGDSFGGLLYRINEMEEYHDGMDYFCEELHVNIGFYLELFGDLFDIGPVKPVDRIKTRSDRPGMVAFLEEIIGIIPFHNFTDVYNANKDNEYVQRALVKLQSDSILFLFDSIGEMPEFLELKEILKEIDVSVDCFICDINNWLERPHPACDDCDRDENKTMAIY